MNFKNCLTLLVRGYVQVGSVVIGSLENKNAYEVLISFGMSGSFHGGSLKCSIESLFADKDGPRFEIASPFVVRLIPRGHYTNLNEPNTSVNDLLGSVDPLEVAVGLAINEIAPGATVCFKRWV